MTRAALAVAVAAACAFLPTSPASACDPSYDPSCTTPCTVVQRYYDHLDRYLADPVPRPVCG